MNVSSTSGISNTNYYSKIQENQTQSGSCVSGIGEAAILDLSSSAATASTATSTSAGASGSNACTMGNGSCTNCGKCGQPSKTNATSLQDSGSGANGTTNYFMSAAINAYSGTSA